MSLIKKRGFGGGLCMCGILMLYAALVSGGIAEEETGASGSAGDTAQSHSEEEELKALMGEMTELYKALETVSTGMTARRIGGGATDRILAELIGETQEPELVAGGGSQAGEDALQIATRYARLWSKGIALILGCLVLGLLVTRLIIGMAVGVDAMRMSRGGVTGTLMPAWLWTIGILLGGMNVARLYLEARRGARRTDETS